VRTPILQGPHGAKMPVEHPRFQVNGADGDVPPLDYAGQKVLDVVEEVPD
jgi:hypothetical protein